MSGDFLRMDVVPNSFRQTVDREDAGMSAARPGTTIRLLAGTTCMALAAFVLAADAPFANTSGPKVNTEFDVSGPYTATIDGQNFPALLDVWGPKAILKISIDGQDKPMIGVFLKNQLKVLFKYGPENFNLTIAAVADYDGHYFAGQYSRADEKLGVKNSKLVLTPAWHGGGGSGHAVQMPLPRRLDDIPGRYGLQLTKDGRSITTGAEFSLDDGMIKVQAGGREYLCDYSDQAIFPVYWQGNRMDTFQLEPTETGFKGTLVKEQAGKREIFETVFTKGEGDGGTGEPRDWTYVYDVIFNNVAPARIGKLTLHQDEVRLAIDVNNVKAQMKGSLVDGILSATGEYGKSPVSIRAQQGTHGFGGVFRKGEGAAVVEMPVVLKNRPVRVFGPSW
jgi:hypothetical protein